MVISWLFVVRVSGGRNAPRGQHIAAYGLIVNRGNTKENAPPRQGKFNREVERPISLWISP
jgi:hypothetical protein